MQAIAYIDGSYDNAVGRYGYGVLFILNDGACEECCGGDLDRTGGWQVNGEIEAAKVAIRHAMDLGCNAITIYYDYEGIRCWPDGIWKTKKEYTKEYKSFVKKARLRLKINFKHVMAHTGNPGNERADKLAKEGIYAPKNWKQTLYQVAEEDIKKDILPYSFGEGMTEAGKRSMEAFLKKKKRSFKDFQSLKTHGRDSFSSMKKDSLLHYAEENKLSKMLETSFEKEAHRLSAIRWMLRGLSPEDAVHKVKVDTEVGQNARKK